MYCHRPNCLGLYFTICLAFLFTNLFKVRIPRLCSAIHFLFQSPIGRLRPDFLSRCKLDQNLKCTGKESLVTEGRRSFPSGHSSSTFGGLGFISLFLSDHFSIFDGSGRIHKFIIFLIPILTASLVSISRIMDYRHHWSDVLAGFLIGCASAITGFFYFYPSLCNKVHQQEMEYAEGSNDRTEVCSEDV